MGNDDNFASQAKFFEVKMWFLKGNGKGKFWRVLGACLSPVIFRILGQEWGTDEVILPDVTRRTRGDEPAEASSAVYLRDSQNQIRSWEC